MTTLPGEIVLRARLHAGLSQRALAQRARTAQSVVARIELGQTSPSWNTLARILAAAGFEARLQLETCVARGSHMLADVPRILAMRPEERLREVANFSRFVRAATHG